MITPAWNWNGIQGNMVVIRGYGPAPTLSTEMKVYVDNVLRQRLASVIPVGASVQLSNPTIIDSQNRILCDVLFNGVSVANYFPEYKL